MKDSETLKREWLVKMKNDCEKTLDKIDIELGRPEVAARVTKYQDRLMHPAGPYELDYRRDNV